MPTYMGICLLSEQVRVMADFYCLLLNTTAEGDDIHTNIITNSTPITIYNPNVGPINRWTMSGDDGRRRFVIELLSEDVDADYRRLKQLGIPIYAEPETHPWAWRSFCVLDPDGNMVNLASPVR